MPHLFNPGHCPFGLGQWPLPSDPWPLQLGYWPFTFNTCPLPLAYRLFLCPLYLALVFCSLVLRSGPRISALVPGAWPSVGHVPCCPCPLCFWPCGPRPIGCWDLGHWPFISVFFLSSACAVAHHPSTLGVIVLGMHVRFCICRATERSDSLK